MNHETSSYKDLTISFFFQILLQGWDQLLLNVITYIIYIVHCRFCQMNNLELQLHWVFQMQ